MNDNAPFMVSIPLIELSVLLKYKLIWDELKKYIENQSLDPEHPYDRAFLKMLDVMDDLE